MHLAIGPLAGIRWRLGAKTVKGICVQSLLDVLQELGFHAREGQAPSGPTILDRRGPVQIYWESTEAIPPSRNRPRHPPIWAARV